MLSFSTWRAAARIPWVRENLDGLRYLRSTLYLLLALHRLGRHQDFRWVLKLYFEMAHSLAQYGRSSAKDTVDRLFEIPWFAAHRRALLQVIIAYNRVLRTVVICGDSRCAPEPTRADLESFVASMKEILAFDRSDEERVQGIMATPGALDEMMAELQMLAAC
jgi:hypothetical protein